MTDPIADMLTRIRNALAKRHEVVEVPSSNLKRNIAEILKQEGYIKDFHQAEYKGQGKILIHLKYTKDNQPAIVGMRRISTPGRRLYVGFEDIQSVYSGTGVSILSTPKGILTDVRARDQKVGGEVLVNIW